MRASLHAFLSGNASRSNPPNPRAPRGVLWSPEPVEARLADALGEAWVSVGEARSIEQADIAVSRYVTSVGARASVWLLRWGHTAEWATEGRNLVALPRPAERLSQWGRFTLGDQLWLIGRRWHTVWEEATHGPLLLEPVALFAPRTALARALLACVGSLASQVPGGSPEVDALEATVRQLEDEGSQTLSRPSSGFPLEDDAEGVFRAARRALRMRHRGDAAAEATRVAGLAAALLAGDRAEARDLAGRFAAHAEVMAEMADQVRRTVPFADVIRGLMQVPDAPDAV